MKHTSSALSCLLALAVLAPCAPANAATAVICRDGQILLPVRYSTNASPATVAAANELARYLHLITGIATFEPAQSNATVDSTGILVGSFDVGGKNGQGDFPSFALSTDLPADSNPTYREGYVIRVGSKSQVWLIGKTDVAVPHSVYRFLEELGCRWFFQGDKWEVVPSKPAISGDSRRFDICDRPAIAQRVLCGESLTDPLDPKAGIQSCMDEDNWHRRNHLQTSTPDGYNSIALHAEQVWAGVISQVNSARSNWFNFGAATPPNPPVAPGPGRYPANRYGWIATSPNPNGNVQVMECANPDVWDMYAWWATHCYLRSNPTADTVPMTPTDGTAAMSESPQSLALGNGSQSDRICTLVNEVARRLSSSPDPQVNGKSVAFLAYTSWMAPPSFPMATNVYVSILPLRNESSQAFADTADLARAWKAKGIKGLGIWDDYSFWPGDRSILLSGYGGTRTDTSADYVSDLIALKNDYQKYASNGVMSIVLESTDCFGAHGLGYYALGKLMWNPDIDITALKDDFYSKAFGSASKDMKAYYDTIDPRNGPMLVSKDLYARACASLTAAATHTADPKVIARINDLKLNMVYNALWFDLFHLNPADPAKQSAMLADVQKILNLSWRIRYSYMINAHGVLQSLPPYAAVVFTNTPAPEWNTANPNASWRTPSNFPSQTEIDALWSYAAGPAGVFTNQLVAQVSYSRDFVAVTNFGAAGPVGSPALYKPIHVALYCTNSATSKTVSLQVDTTTVLPTSAGATVTLTDKNGVTVGAPQSVPPGTKWKTLTFDVPRSQEGYVAKVDPHASAAGVQVPVGAAMGTILDKTFTLDIGVGAYTQNAYFYVPKGCAKIQYYWRRQSLFDSGGSYPIVQPPFHTNIPTAFCDAQGASYPIGSDMEACSIPVPPGQDGKVWHIRNLVASQLWFYNIPNIFAVSAGALVVPREVAMKDGLQLR